MDEPYPSIISEEERRARRAQRAAVRRKKQLERRRRMLRQLVPAGALALAAVVLLSAWGLQKKPEAAAIEPEEPVAAVQTVYEAPEPQGPYTVEADSATVTLDDTIDSSYAVVIDVDSGTILAQKAADTRINPASMTKVLTLLVAAEHVEDRLDDTVTMTIDITDYCYVNDCSVVGLEVGEQATVRELLYGTILPSGADAAMALAAYVSGSHEAFVELMNEKLEELGLSDTAHFTNCVGLYDEVHMCTVSDMALILKAAMDNPLCREVLDARTYETAPTPEHPEGQVLSNWFLRRIEDRFTDSFQIVGGKTGYVVEAGSCAASCGQAGDGSLYVCVTADASSSWQAIYDHTALYQTYCA